MTSLPTDPFALLAKQYDPSKLIWACSNRANLKQDPPLQLNQDTNGTIRVQEINSRFQEKTGVQVGYQFLQLQGKNIADYQGGLEEIQKTIKESLAIEVVVLKEYDVDSQSPTVPTKRKSKRKSDTIKNSPSITKKDNKKTRENPLAELQNRYNNKDLLWVTNTRCSTTQPVPFQLIQDDKNVIRIHQVDPEFQLSTGVQEGQRLAMFQERDIESYQDLDEIQAIIQETLEINLVVVSKKKNNKKKKKKRSKEPSLTIDAIVADNRVSVVV